MRRDSLILYAASDCSDCSLKPRCTTAKRRFVTRHLHQDALERMNGRVGLPVICVESRQAYQALKSLATHKTDRNDARGLAHLARTGFFKPVHVKSLSAHAVRSLIIARKKLVGQRVTLENQIRGLAVVFGIRLPRALTQLGRIGGAV
jgi:transposase